MQPLQPVLANDERARTSLMLFRILLAILSLNLLAELVLSFKLNDPTDMFDSANRYMIIVTGLIALFRSLFTILLAVFFIMWMRRAYHNLHKAGSTYLSFSEGWASGAWFVPFINLGRPWKIMSEIFQETQMVFRKPNEFGFEKEHDNITGWWWASFITSGVVAQIGSIFIRSGNLRTGYLFAAVSDLGYVMAAVLAMNMIKRISAMETDMMARAQAYYAELSAQYAAQYQQYQQQQPPAPGSGYEPPQNFGN